jgi:hypothetical protein
MTDTALIIDNLINTEGIHAFVFICEAADKYLPMVEALSVQLGNGQQVPVTQMDRTVSQKVDETRRALKREDRIVWALRFYKKALAEQLLWMVQNDPGYFKRKFHSPPAPEQPGLVRTLQKLADVDITPFQEFDPDDPSALESPYSGFTTIDAINTRMGHYIAVNEKYGQTDPQNPINALRLERQSYGEITSLYRRTEIALRRKKFPGGITMTPTPEGPYDLKDKEGPVETVVQFPDGWRWFDLHRGYSAFRDDRTAPSDIAITGHCANNAGKCGFTTFELAEPLGDDRWKHHAFFVLHKNGLLGERKGRKNQKPSPKLEKYIFELLRRVKIIKGLGSDRAGHNSSTDFQLSDLTPAHQEILKQERPKLFTSTGEVRDD